MAPLLSGRRSEEDAPESSIGSQSDSSSRAGGNRENKQSVRMGSLIESLMAEWVLSTPVEDEAMGEREALCRTGQRGEKSQRRKRRRRRRRRREGTVLASEQDKMLQLNDSFKRRRRQQQQHQQMRRRDSVWRGSSSSGPARFILLAALLTPVLLLIFTALPVASVDCFKCSSRNGSNPACEDPFHNLNTTRITMPIPPEPQPTVIYHTPCYAGRKNREGLFPASACIKLTGVFDTTGETLVVRHCALDSGSLTQDTELARMSHCGKFQFEGDLLRGCVLACPEDGCNGAHSSLNFMNKMPLYIFWLLLVAALLTNRS